MTAKRFFRRRVLLPVLTVGRWLFVVEPFEMRRERWFHPSELALRWWGAALATISALLLVWFLFPALDGSAGSQPDAGVMRETAMVAAGLGAWRFYPALATDRRMVRSARLSFVGLLGGMLFSFSTVHGSRFPRSWASRVEPGRERS